MMEIVSKITISEVMLLFILIFLLPIVTFLLLRLRKYEARFGQLPDEEKKKKKKKKKTGDAAAMAGSAADETPETVYPYRATAFLSSSDHSCLAALGQALGEVDVYPGVALWKAVEATDKNSSHTARLDGKAFDFLVCDSLTGQPLTAVLYKPAKGMPAGDADEIQKICAAAEIGVVFIDMAETYDAGTLKQAMGIPEMEF